MSENNSNLNFANINLNLGIPINDKNMNVMPSEEYGMMQKDFTMN